MRVDEELAMLGSHQGDEGLGVMCAVIEWKKGEIEAGQMIAKQAFEIVVYHSNINCMMEGVRKSLDLRGEISSQQGRSNGAHRVIYPGDFSVTGLGLLEG